MRRTRAGFSGGAWALAALAVVTAGCSSVSDYAKARALDLWDVVPVSVRCGPGVKVTTMATEFLGAGVGGGVAYAAGMSRGRWGPIWKEAAVHVIVTGFEAWTLPSDDARVRHWPGGPRPSLSRAHAARNSGRTFLVIPDGIGPDGWTSHKDGNPHVPDPWYSWADVEVDVFAGVGLRAGLCPGELVDFLAGLFRFDLVGDDPGGANDRYWEENSRL